MKIVERDVGAFPISIGTSLAFEGLFGIHPNQTKNIVDTSTVKEIWINIRTLARNIFSAVPTAQQSSTEPRHLVDVLLTEMESIPDIFKQAGSNIAIKYYISAADNIKWLVPKAKFKQPKTPKQILTEIIERSISIDVLDALKSANIDYMEISNKPERTIGTILLLSHHAHELLWKDQFDRLLLLESHTGKVKPYNLWYTKLNGIKEKEDLMPFNLFTLQVFGEGFLIEPQSRNIRNALKKLAKDKKWTPITTQDKIYFDLTTHASQELKETYIMLR